jgi:hypothetical protein
MLCGRRYIGKSPKGRKSNGICLAMVASHQVNHVNDVSIMDIFVAEGAHPPAVSPIVTMRVIVVVSSHLVPIAEAGI